MASISCTNCGAVLKTKDPIAPGKKVKCPKCNEAFVVAAEEEEKPEPEEKEEESAGEAEEKEKDEAEEEKPKKKGKAAEDDEPEEADDKKKKPPAPKGKGMLIGLVLGGLLLACCCCGGGGTGGWYFWSQSASAPAFVGVWESKNKEDDGSPEITLMIIANGKGNYLRAKKPPEDFKWRTVDATTVEFDLDDPTKKKTFWVGRSRPNFNYTLENEGKTLTLVTTQEKRKTVFDKKSP